MRRRLLPYNIFPPIASHYYPNSPLLCSMPSINRVDFGGPSTCQVDSFGYNAPMLPQNAGVSVADTGFQAFIELNFMRI